MRKNRLLIGTILMVLGCLSFAGCQSEGNDEKVITFEDVNLGEKGYWDGSDQTGSFTSGILTCNNVYEYSWSGMACSSLTDMETVGFGNQFSVYATSGAGGSKNFAVLYPYLDRCKCSFSNEHEIKSLMVNNSTYAYLAVKDGKDGYLNTTKFVSGDYFRLTIFGYDQNNVLTDSVDFYLADFRNQKSYVCKDWTKVNLTSLGKVKTISFKLASTDNGEWGMNTPGYACIDNIVYSE